MASIEWEQQGINVPQHKRIALGEMLDGTDMQPNKNNSGGKPAGGLSHAKVQKKNK